MPYKTGAFQAALGALSAIAFLVSTRFGSSPGSNLQQCVGRMEKTGPRAFTITKDDGKSLPMDLGDSFSIHRNDQVVPFESIEDGRKASVRYFRNGRRLVAAEIEVFITHLDACNPPD